MQVSLERHVGSRDAHIVSRYAWTTASIDVSVDGSVVLRTGGAMKVTGTATAKFEHEGMPRQVALSWGAGRLHSFPSRLEIDSFLVANSRVTVSNWWSAYWPLAAVIALAALWHFCSPT